MMTTETDLTPFPIISASEAEIETSNIEHLPYELCREICLYTIPKDIIKLTRLSPTMRRKFNRFSWEKIIVADEKVCRIISPEMHSLRCVPMSSMRCFKRYKWIKCEYIVNIEVYQCSYTSIPYLPFTRDVLCNLKDITIGFLHEIPYCRCLCTTWYEPTYRCLRDPITKAIYKLAPNAFKITVINRNTETTYARMAYHNDIHFFISKNPQRMTSMISYDRNMRQSVPDLIRQTKLMTNLKTLTFCPSRHLSLRDYNNFMKSLHTLESLEYLTTTHYFDFQSQNYTACQFAPRNIKKYEIVLNIGSTLTLEPLELPEDLPRSISQVTSASFIVSNQFFYNEPCIFNFPNLFPNLYQLSMFQISFRPHPLRFFTEHTQKLVRLKIEIENYDDFSFLIKNLKGCVNLQHLSIFLVYRHIKLEEYKYKLQHLETDLIMQKLQQLNESINKGTIGTRILQEDDYEHLINYLDSSLDCKKLRFDEAITYIFKILQYPARFIDQEFPKLRKSLRRLRHDQTKSHVEECYSALFNYVFFEAFYEQIYNLPKIEYVQVIGHRYAFESPRFQKLLNHSMLKQIQVTEDMKREPKTLDNIWYSKYITVANNPNFENFFYFPAILNIINTYEVDVEGIRQKSAMRNYDIACEKSN